MQGRTYNNRTYERRDPEEVRSRQIMVPVTPAFLALVDAKAAELGKSRAEFCRETLAAALT